MDGLKRCTRCGQAKPRTEFGRHAWRADGLQDRCKACRAAYRKEHPEEREQHNARGRTWAAAHPEWRNRVNGQERAIQAETLKQARRNGYLWTGPELELAARPDLTKEQVALMTGRTLHAVRHARRKLRDDPKTIAHAGLDDPADAMTAPGMSFGPVRP